MRISNAAAVAAAVLAPVLYLGVLDAANSPVADAAMKGDLAAVRAALAKGADVDAPQADGATALQWAAYRNDAALADVLLAAKADPTITNRDGFTALRMAAMNGNAQLIGKLLAAGADANEKSPYGETPLMFAARNGNPAALEALIARGADVNAAESIRGTTPLMWAAEQGHPEAMKSLIAKGAEVSAASKADTKGGRAYLAPSIAGRAKQDKDLRNRLKSGENEQDLLAGFQAGDFGGQGKGGKQFGKGGGKGKGKGKAPEAKAGEGNDGEEEDVVAAADAQAAEFSFGRTADTNGGKLTALIFAARQNCIECARILLDAGADVNQKSNYGWSPLLTATQNRHYKLGTLLLERGADPNIQNNGGWSPLYLATDNRNIETGDYPVPKADMDHLEYIESLLAKGANVNARICGSNSTPERCQGDSTETRTNFTMQWLDEAGSTAFLRASQSGDVDLMKLLLAKGADPKINTQFNVSPLAVAAGIAWVEGVTFEWSPEKNVEAVKLLLSLGLDPNIQDQDGRTALHGAAHKGRNEVVKFLVDAGGDLTINDFGSRDTFQGEMRGVTWFPLHYAQGLVRVGVQSAIAHPETAALIKDLMTQKGLTIPADITSSICLTKGIKGCQ